VAVAVSCGLVAALDKTDDDANSELAPRSVSVLSLDREPGPIRSSQISHGPESVPRSVHSLSTALIMKKNFKSIVAFLTER